MNSSIQSLMRRALLAKMKASGISLEPERSSDWVTQGRLPKLPNNVSQSDSTPAPIQSNSQCLCVSYQALVNYMENPRERALHPSPVRLGRSLVVLPVISSSIPLRTRLDELCMLFHELAENASSSYIYCSSVTSIAQLRDVLQECTHVAFVIQSEDQTVLRRIIASSSLLHVLDQD